VIMAGQPASEKEPRAQEAALPMTQERAESYAREVSLRETKARMDELLGMASHELRTPLTTIKGNIQLARIRLKYLERQLRQNDPSWESVVEEIHTMLSRAERQVNMQDRLIRDLMDLTNIQIGKLELNKELCNLIDIVFTTVEDQRSVVPGRTIELELQGHEIIPMLVDAERISQALSNYLTNALKYSPAEKPVFVSLEVRGDEARVAVRDEGPGLTLPEQQQVWERFTKIKGIQAQKGFSSGLGLGLHICKAVIEGHHGQVGVESAKGKGSTFWFSLPLATAALDV
jgi:signal transduction histidine kinase